MWRPITLFFRVVEMSQIITESAQPLEAIEPSFDPVDEFDYRPVPPLAPISLFLGICALSGFLGIPCLAVGFVGMVLGAIALRQIRRSDGYLGGKGIARLGVALSALLFFAGSGYHAYAYAAELPEGYQRVSFLDLSKYELKVVDGKPVFSPEVEALNGKPIYIKGYMYPTGQLRGISEFVLVKDTGQCCFGGQPKLTDMIVVKFDDANPVSHREQQLVGVGGIFRASGAVQSGSLTPIYQIDGTHFK
jgi:hypothetical protein